jgi:tRNA modification GTPase
MRDGDTIVALSSGTVPAGVAVIRLSGPLARRSLERFTGSLPAPRRLTLAAIKTDGQVLDHGLIAWFPGPHSFTGEDCAELQVHGSPAVVRALLRALAAQDGVRLAEAGEFTRRAFENGRLDLTEVEGLGDLIAAETENQRRQAVARLDGSLSRQLESWRLRLLDTRAEIEARLDFADEGDVDTDLPPSVGETIDELLLEMTKALADLSHGRIVREGLRVALAGLPNAGKSSLLNALANSDLAIVSDEPGTTRDVREVAIDVGGQLVILVDMAGLRETESRAEAEGVRRARAEIGQADLVLWLVAADGENALPGIETTAPRWTIGTKSDLGVSNGSVALDISVKTGDGLGALLDRLTLFAETATGHGEPALLDRERDREAVASAISALRDARASLSQMELAAEALRRAADALSRLLGRMDTEMVLDRLFAAFCIGK